MADWMDLDPPPVGVNMTPLFDGYVYDPEFRREVDRILDGPDPSDPWLEQDAELGLHVPWCGVHFSESGVCTENCRPEQRHYQRSVDAP